MRANGVGVGGGLAVLLDNHARFLELYWVAQRSGLYFTPMSWHATVDEVAYILENSGASVFIASERFAEVAAQAVARLAHGVVTLSADGSFGQSVRFNSYVSERDRCASGRLEDETYGDDMLYTSGTTGRPKGVRRPLSGSPIDEYPPHFTHYASAGYNEHSVHYSAGPLYHASPLHTTIVAMTFGGSIVVSDRFDPEESLALIERHRVTHSNWVPTHFIRLLRLPEERRSNYDLSSLQLVLHGAAPCPVWVKHDLIEWLGPIVTEYYGGSEGFGSSLITSKEWLAHPGSVGRSVGAPIHVVDADTGVELPCGEIGVVYFEHPMTEMSYHGDDAKTAAARTKEGWATLGDIGHVDADGYLFLADRRADLIITGGVNVYPREVEDRILSHPLVADVAVFGVPDEDFGERVQAVVELLDPSSAPDDVARQLLAHCRQTLASYKCPRGPENVVIVDSLPRKENGKLYKRLLRDQYRTAPPKEATGPYEP